MTTLTDETTDTAIEVVRKAGIAITVSRRGSRLTAEIIREGKKQRAVLKTASVGNAMVNADIDDADAATLRALEGVDLVLFAVGRTGSDLVQAYLVPVGVVEKAYRDTHRHWRSTHPEKGNANTTWVLPFGPTKDAFLGGFANKWASYMIGELRRGAADGPEPALVTPPLVQPVGLSVEEAKRGLALRYGLPTDRIKIVMEH